MKKFILIFTVCLLFFSCTSKQNEAEKKVINYLKEHLIGIEGYSNIEMGKLEQLTWMELYVQENLDRLKNKEITIEEHTENISNFRDNLENKKMNPDSIIAYTIKHKFSVKNSFGTDVIKNVQYTFDNKLDQIIDIQEID